MSPNSTGASDILDCENFLVFDIVDNIIIPWIEEHYNVPSPMRGIRKYEEMLKAVEERLAKM